MLFNVDLPTSRCYHISKWTNGGLLSLALTHGRKGLATGKLRASLDGGESLKLRRLRALAFCYCALGAGGSAFSQEVLLIPDSDTDSVGIYDPFNGDFVADLIGPSTQLSRPICAIRGPEGLIYVSDQTLDAVFRFDQSGVFVDQFCGPGNGLDNVRGIAFQGSDLLVCYASTSNASDRGIARFSSAGARLSNAVGATIDPFDVFVAGGDLLVSDIASNQVVRIANGTGAITTLFSVAFPEQINQRVNAPSFLNIAYAGDVITEFDLTPQVFHVTPITGLGRGIVELGNGNYLLTNSTTVCEADPQSGSRIRVVRSGGGFRFIERVTLGPIGCSDQVCAAADFDGTCVIDLVDLTLFLGAFGDTGAPGSVFGDTNNDGLVDLTDLTTVLALFGSDCNP